MLKEKSCGALVYRWLDDQALFLLIQHKNGGHWAFTKGHVEGQETEVETAHREILEEVHLDLEIDDRVRKSLEYSPYEGCMKEVVYFVALCPEEIADQVETQEAEVLRAAWFDYETACDHLTYENDRKILSLAKEYIEKKHA